MVSPLGMRRSCVQQRCARRCRTWLWPLLPGCDRVRVPSASDPRRSIAPSGRRGLLRAWKNIPLNKIPAPPFSRSLSLPEPCPMTSCIAVSRSSASSPYFLLRSAISGVAANSSAAVWPDSFVEGASAAGEEEILGAVLFVNFVLVGQVVADGVDVQIRRSRSGSQWLSPPAA